MNNKILVVDDQSDIRKLIRITLGKAYDVLEAEDAITAHEIILRHHPVVVVLDIMMPGPMNGLHLLDAIRADPELKDTRVIMVTARGQARDYEIGMARGADRYIIKPFSPLLLAGVIKEFAG